MRLSKDSCKKSLSQDSLTLEELSSRLTGLVKGFATEEAAREYSRASTSVGRRERHSLSASFTALAAVRIMEEQANSARLARASESPADSAASGSTPLTRARAIPWCEARRWSDTRILGRKTDHDAACHAHARSVPVICACVCCVLETCGVSFVLCLFSDS